MARVAIQAKISVMFATAPAPFAPFAAFDYRQRLAHGLPRSGKHRFDFCRQPGLHGALQSGLHGGLKFGKLLAQGALFVETCSLDRKSVV